ncbi:DUF2993 domain-containing protein [Lyngbya sp. CCY1209]|uniref:LmeA family phospholipid-binding protein n=1 Tax=Lyngbya sp. CCY1209 TaxID=2886103 RepID=UPI002D2098C6|nr:DUF2993 domain-containing protein [Lyngbya sp. CCY1209]MEB3886294.1 DUF2993 domain-containing protein [Lyngbya sp. CCY1209]
MKATEAQQKKLIGTVLSAAVQFYLRSQAERVESLKIHIGGNNRSLLSGRIPDVSVSARGVIYRGLHLSQIALNASRIRINLGQVLQGKPLQLLEPIPVECDLQLYAGDLDASARSPLLADALTQLLRSHFLLPAGNLENLQLTLGANRLKLTADLTGVPLTLTTQLQLASPTQLRLAEPRLQMPHLVPETHRSDMTLDLGSDVDIQDLGVSAEQLTLRGIIWVKP